MEHVVALLQDSVEHCFLLSALACVSSYIFSMKSQWGQWPCVRSSSVTIQIKEKSNVSNLQLIPSAIALLDMEEDAVRQSLCCGM